MTIQLVSNGTATTSSASPLTVTVNSGAGTANGNLCVVALAMPGYSAAPAFTFPAGWVQGPVQAFGSGACAQLWYLPGASNPGGITTISVTWSGGSTVNANARIIHFGAEFSGVASVSPLDQTGSGHGTASPENEATSGNLAQAHELAVTVSAWWNSTSATISLAPGSGFTQISNAGDGSNAQRHVSGDYNPDTGAARSAVTDAVTFGSAASAFAWVIATFYPTSYALPAAQPMPPGLQSPAAWQLVPALRLGQVVTIAGAGGVVLPKPSLAGTGNATFSVALPAVRPMPPGYLSPAAWQQPPYPRLGQVVTIAGSGGVVLPKPSLSGQGAVSPPAVLPAVQLMPPGYLSPAAWQAPRYTRLGQTLTIAGSGGVVLPKPSLAGSGAEASPPVAQLPLMPPGLSSPAAWQFPPYRRLGQTAMAAIAGSGGVVLPKPSLAGTGTAPPRIGSWWGLDTVFKQSKQEFEAYVSRPPDACPNDGEPLRYAPATASGSGVQLYCPFCGFQYPRDWRTPQRPYP